MKKALKEDEDDDGDEDDDFNEEDVMGKVLEEHEMKMVVSGSSSNICYTNKHTKDEFVTADLYKETSVTRTRSININYLFILTDILGEIVDASKLDFGSHPAIKAVAVIKEFLSHSVCGNPIEGSGECLVHCMVSSRHSYDY